MQASKRFMFFYMNIKFSSTYLWITYQSNLENIVFDSTRNKNEIKNLESLGLGLGVMREGMICAILMPKIKALRVH